MNKGDVEFTVSLNTSPAEQQLDKLYEKMRTPGVSNHREPLLQRIANEYQQGFKMVGGVYDTGSNHFGVPSTKVLETALVVTAQSFEKFNNVIRNVIQLSNSAVDSYFRQISQPRLGYTPNTMSPFRTNAYERLGMIGNPYSRDFSLQGNTYDGYMSGANSYGVPSTVVNAGGLVPVGKAFSSWSPSQFYTRSQVEDINRGVSGGYNPSEIFDSLIYKRKTGQKYSSAYDIFSSVYSSEGASGMHDIWKGLFGNKGLLSLPSPKSGWTGVDGSDTPEEQGKDIVDQNKKDNDELKEKLLLWGRILSTIYAIRKVLQGLSKLWKFATDTISGVNSNINEEHGFFSTDPEGALRANTDKTRAMLYAGVRNMGENAPVSKSGLDYASNKITEMWTSAMSGRNVDARTTIDVQRLKDFFGIDLSVAGLLTGEREGKTATDIQIDMMDKVEKQISKLAEADEVTKGQVIDSLKNILGDELVNAIVANANKNLKIDATDLKLTLAERIMQNGGTAIASGDLTTSTESSVKALSALNTEIGKLKNTLIQELSPAFVTVAETLANIVDWLNRKMNKVDGEKNAIGEVKAKVSIASLTNDEYSRYRNFKQKEDDKKDKYKDKDNTVRNLLKSGDPLKILEALYLSQPEVKSAADIENLGIKQQEIEVGNAFKNAYKTGKFDPNSTNPLIRALAEHSYINPDNGRTYYGYEAFTQELDTNPNIGWNDPFISRLLKNPENMDEHEMLIAMRNMASLNPAVRNAFSKEFDKGGMFDFGTSMAMIPYLYSTRMLGSPEEQFKAFQVLAQESYKVLDNVVNLDVNHNDRNGNGKIDAGEIELKVILKDQYGKTLTTQSINADLN